MHAAETGDPRRMGGAAGLYVGVLQRAIQRPGATRLLGVAMLLGSFGACGQFGRGLSFLPSVEPEFMQVQVRARDNISICKRDALVRAVEDRLLDLDEIESVYGRSSMSASQGDEETIGTIQLDLVD